MCRKYKEAYQKNIYMIGKPIKSWGGRRPNSGRKADGDKPKIKLTISIDPEVKAKLNQIARENGISVSEIANQILRKYT
jgi:hypothetical protein